MQKILEVAIGVVLVFGIFSVVVSSITESISGLLGRRHSNLIEGLARMLDGTAGPGPITQLVLAHPLIESISKGKRSPSYIDAVTFTTAFLDATDLSKRAVEVVLADGAAIMAKIDAVSDAALKAQLAKAWAAAEQQKAPFVRALLDARSAADPEAEPMLEAVFGNATQVDAQLQALASAARTDSDKRMADFLQGQWQQANRDVPAFIASLLTSTLIARAVTGTAELRADLEGLPAPLSTSLVALWDMADADFTKFRHGVEDWFDRQMERASGWYGKSTQWWMFLVALALAASMNVSGTTIARSLWADPALSTATADLAASTVSSTTTTTTSSSTSTSTTTAGGTTPTTATPAVTPTYQDLVDLGLPVGWNKTAWPGWKPELLIHLLGILIVAIAGSFGAPVWFDLLGKLVNLRVAGPKPASAAAQRAS